MSRLANLPCSLPTVSIPPEANPIEIATSFGQELGALDASHFTKDTLWRDTFALTGTMRTFYSANSISAAWNETCGAVKARLFMINAGLSRIVRISEESAWVDAYFSFETAAQPATVCSGIASLVPSSNGKWKVWVLRTILEQLKFQANVDVLEPTNEAHNPRNSPEATHFDCVVVGGGQAGLSTAGRLKALGISYVVLEKNKAVGDNWKTRYESARLHTIREYSHLPFDRTFPSNYQEFLTKDDLAKGYQDWALKFGIDIWLATTLTAGTWKPDQRVWELMIRRESHQSKITSSNIVLAVGGGCQIPVAPSYPNLENFAGVVLHSADYTNAFAWKGKHGIVVGTANTGHDIAEDMVRAGLSSVTMVQRSQTYVLPYEYYRKLLSVLFNKTIPTDLADRLFNSNPLPVSRLVTLATLNAMAREQPERFDALERCGFKTERYGDLVYHIFERFGGHYMDTGASDKIVRGLIKVKSDALPVRYIKDGLEFSNGDWLKADIIIFATGFVGNLRYVVENLFGSEIASNMGDFWGTDEEGELMGAFKPCGQPALWYHGGTLGQARYYSRFISLQIKAALLGTPLPIYQKTP